MRIDYETLTPEGLRELRATWDAIWLADEWIWGYDHVPDAGPKRLKVLQIEVRAEDHERAKAEILGA